MNEQQSNPPQEDAEKTQPSPKQSTASCKSCGKPTKRMMFRTGSVQHPGRDMNVCSGCGARE